MLILGLVTVLWAESVLDPEQIEKVGGYATLIVAGGAIKWVWDKVADRLDKRRQESQADEATVITRLNELLKRVDDDRKECREDNIRIEDRLRTVQGDLVRAQVISERAVTWIKHLETLLEGITPPVRFRKWQDVVTPGLPDDSATHTPVPNAVVRPGGPP